MARVAYLLIFLACVQVQSVAQHEPGYCAFYKECGLNPSLNRTAIVPCLNYTRAVLLKGEHYRRLKQVCPTLDQGEGNTSACCSIKQLSTLQSSLRLAKMVLTRCPACAENFAHLHCINTCSPNQSQFVKVTKVMNATDRGLTREVVVRYEAFLSTSVADATFQSCKNVRIPLLGTHVIGTMCGQYSSKQCTPQRWYDYQGSTSNGMAPLDIDIRLINVEDNKGLPEGMVPYNGRALRCNETTPAGSPACTCTDCPESCPKIHAAPVEPVGPAGPAGSALPPPAPGSLGLLRADSLRAISIFFFCLLILGFLFYLHFLWLVRYWKRNDEAEVEGESRLMKMRMKMCYRCIEKIRMAALAFLNSAFEKCGTFVAIRTVKVLLLSAIFVAVLAAGLMYIKLTTDPVELWSAPDSRARQEKNFHDSHFGPFFRTNQLILTAPDRKGHIYDSLFGQHQFSGIISKDLIIELLELQKQIQNIEFWSEDLNRNASLKDVCFAPLNPSSPSLTDCAVNSLPQYFQNSVDHINAKVNMTKQGVTKEVDWRDHLIYCLNSPLSMNDMTDLKMSCMADYGAPVFSFLAVGGYNNDNFTNAKALILTFSLNNYPRDDPRFNVAMQWESEFLKIVQAYQKNPASNFTFAYMAERSVPDETNRTVHADFTKFLIIFVVQAVVIAVILGKYSSWKRILVEAKFLLGVGGILVVACSVLASMGFYSWIGISFSPVSMLAVTPLLHTICQTMFIFILAYQRDQRRPGEKTEQQIGRVLGNVAPNMLVLSLLMSICFFLGALSTIPAGKFFASYASLAVPIGFVLQVTAVVALLSLDARCQEQNRCEPPCCVPTPQANTPNNGFLLHRYTRIGVILLLLLVFCGSIFLMSNMRVGLNQEQAMPQDSHMLDYFKYLNKYLKVGIPVYFVTKGGYNFSTVAGMNGVCSSVGCDPFSLTQKIHYATQYPELSYLAIPANSWVDDFIDWLNPESGCCRLSFSGSFCPADGASSWFCSNCMRSPATGVLRPSVRQFNRLLPEFLRNKPSMHCPKGGLGAYDKAVVKDASGEIIASRFMAYHIPLTNSQEYTAALQMTRELAHNITMGMRNILGTSPDFEVFAYTVTNVLYEQYLTIVSEGLFNFYSCLLAIFLVSWLWLDLLSALINILTITMIIVDAVAAMGLLGIDYNAVTQLSFGTGLGLSVAFVFPMAAFFGHSTKPTQVERVMEALNIVGKAMICITGLGIMASILMLATAKSPLVQIFFWQNMVFILFAVVHGFIFLPTVLSFFGPAVREGVVLQVEQSGASAGEEVEEKDETGQSFELQ